MIPQLIRLENALDVAEAYAELSGAAKGRDSKEPGYRKKLQAETKFQATVRRMFKSQLDAITRWADMSFQPAKSQTFKAAPPSADEEIDRTEEAWRAEFYRHYLSAIMDGVELWKGTAKFDLDYTKINPDAVKAAQRMSLYLIRDVNSTTKAVIRDVIRQFVDTPGMTLGDVIKMLPFDAQRAERIAVTEITRAYAQANTNIGAELKREFPNVPVVKYWFTNQDDRVCEICGPLDTGKPVPFDKPFNAALGIDSPPAHVSCLPADRLVSPVGRIAATSERQFNGYVVIVNTAGHKSLACTPNHPILTPGGWVPARLLNVGDHVISSRFSHLPFTGDADYKDVPASIHDVAETFRRSRQVFAAPVPVTAEDFHGDRGGGNVAVVHADCLLRNDGKATIFEQANEFDFAGGLMAAGSLNRQGMSDPGGFAPSRSEDGTMRGANLGGALVGRHARPLEALSIGLRTDRGAVLNEDAPNGGAVYAPSFRYGVFGFASYVCFDQVVSVRNVQFSGHVFNLQTTSGIYIADGIITHNCRCWSQVTTDL